MDTPLVQEKDAFTTEISSLQELEEAKQQLSKDLERMMEEQQEPPVTEQREAPISIRRGPLPQEPPPEKPARTFEPLPSFRPAAVGERFSRPSSALLTVARANLRFHMEKAPPSQSLQSLE